MSGFNENTEGKRFNARLRKNNLNENENNPMAYSDKMYSQNINSMQNNKIGHSDSLTEKFIKNSLQINKQDLYDPLNPEPLKSLFFRVHVSGVIESANFYEGDAIYCKYDLVHGNEWEKEEGVLSGQSQYACKGEGSFDYFVWNMPFETSFRSTNPYGWPQLVITCAYPDFFGREVIKGYGVCHIPTTPGRHERTIQIFSPITSSIILKFLGVIMGQRAEIINAPKVVASGDGREITRTKSEGSVKVIFQVTLRDMEKFGYVV